MTAATAAASGTAAASAASAATVARDSAGRRRGRAPSEAQLALAMVAAVSLAPVAGSDPIGSRGGQVIFAALTTLTAAAALTGQPRVTRLGLALTTTIAAFALPWQVAWWPLPGLAGVGAYLAAGRLPFLRTGPMIAWRRGRLGRGEWVAISAVGLIASTGLLIYQRMHPATFEFGAGLLNQLPAWSPPLVGPAFVAVNAAVEEMLFRGMILTHLTRAVGTWPALITQAVGFGALNLHGYPDGVIGVAMTAGYGLLLGLLRLRASGLLACWIAHAVADAVIFAFIAQAAAHQL
jgi:membrane protease YdiL (CAAX protease family)